MASVPRASPAGYGFGRFRARRCVLAAAWIGSVWSQGAQAAPPQAVYRYAGKDGMPVYTNAAPGKARTGELVLVVGHQGEREAAGRKEPVAPRPDFLPQLDRVIAVVAGRNGVEAALVRAVIEVESAFNLQARSRTGAVGLMQLMPATASRYGVTDARDPLQNVEAGTRYLRDLLRMFDGDARLALAAYNAGEGAVLKYKRSIPPFEETQRYVPAVLARWDRNRIDDTLPRLAPTRSPR